MRATTALLAALLAPALCLGEKTLPGYEWQEVADGVFLHQPVDPLAGPVDGNSVIIDSGDGVVVIDTHINPAAARATIAKIREALGKPVTHVVNTHWHDDHTNGNHAYRDAFPDTQVVAHQATLKKLEEEWQAMEDQRTEAYARVEPEQIIAAANALDDPEQAIGYRLYAAYVAALKPELPTMQLVYPDTVFEDSLVLGHGERRIELKWLGRGNTDGDIIAWLPNERILATGDMLVAPVPFAFDSPMTDWIDTLDRLAAIDATIIIPGHGPVQHDKGYLDAVRKLLRSTVNQVRIAQAAGVDYAGLADAVDLGDAKELFTQGNADRMYAWQSYFVAPGLKSAWAGLGYPLPEEAN
ncbi:MAG TPA: MBL fold metallo-hydrolase [Woeseiaceae bacterium]|jgi:glyoxylase-like metal-dependent hydrolase (beta-lactamase superfamily II)|nr:MBL fold metallo-hydrolase [Woeseiaceae bacterium]